MEDSADGDNEQTMVYKKKDMSMANIGRKSRTARKTRRGVADDEALSAGEMDDDQEAKSREKRKKDEAKVAKVFGKHGNLIGNARRKVLAEEHFDKMMFYLDCEMNLLIYGVGSKRGILQDFLQNQIWLRYPSINVRGYHSGLMPKTILTDITEYIREHIERKAKPAVPRKWANTTEIMEHIKRKLMNAEANLAKEESELEPVIILIHSMDIGVLKGQEW